MIDGGPGPDILYGLGGDDTIYFDASDRRALDDSSRQRERFRLTKAGSLPCYGKLS